MDICFSLFGTVSPGLKRSVRPSPSISTQDKFAQGAAIDINLPLPYDLILRN